MNRRTIRWLTVIFLGCAVGTALYVRQQQAPLPQASIPVEPPVAATIERAAPPIRYPIQRQAADPVMPKLEESDQSLWDALAEVLGNRALESFFLPDEIVRHIVVTIDNLPRQTAAVRLFPVKPVGGRFLTTGEGETLAIAGENAARYARYVRLAETADPVHLTEVYMRFYPLFQRAYEELGYPNAYFNDRLVAVIDHLLDAPEPGEPVRLVQPTIVYRYADRDLEAGSAGHKILVRMGAGNAAKVKAKLRMIRRELTGEPVAQ